MYDTTLEQGEYKFFDFKPAASDVHAEVIEGLASKPKSVSPKYFYDESGSKLFEEITRLPEYYLTRTELALFDQYLDEVAKLLTGDLCVVEYGSGSSLKIRRLLNALTPKAYVPVDISDEFLQNSAKTLHQDFPKLNVYPVCADITRQIQLPEAVSGLTPVAFYPGSSIGNFEPTEAVRFMQNVHQTITQGGFLLLGVDRKKDPALLEAAYDDSQGVTAAFNLNILAHLGEQLDADFSADQFKHGAQYNRELGCIQMFLESATEQAVVVADQSVHFAAGER